MWYRSGKSNRNMIRYLQNWRNAHQFEILLACVLLVLIIGIVFQVQATEKQFNQYCIILSCLYVIAVFYVTVISRKQGGELEYNHEIFWSYKLALHDGGYFMQIILNIMLFVPLGILWAGIVRRHKFCFYFLMMIGGGLFSGCIELLQYRLQCGFSEIDDIISNTIGLMTGIILWELALWCQKKTSCLIYK